MKKYVLFDFDGVIANTEESNGRYLEKALKCYGITLTKDERVGLIGTGDKTFLDPILARSTVPVSTEELQKTRTRLGNTYENGDLQPMPGVISMIHYLRERGVGTAIATSTSARLILTALNRMHMTALFDSIVCGDMCTESKPSPQIYQKTMFCLSANPEDCIVIEDSTAGISAGKGAGAYVIAYTESGLPQDRSQADVSVDSYEACKKKISEILNLFP